MTKEPYHSVSLQGGVSQTAGPGLIHHSDRGSQYCSHEYRKILDQFGMKASMSRKGNCYDNAPMESFWGMLKSELIHHRRYKTRQEAIREITEHIEVFYNRQRRQKRLGYLSPAAYERQYLCQKGSGMRDYLVSTIDSRAHRRSPVQIRSPQPKK